MISKAKQLFYSINRRDGAWVLVASVTEKLINFLLIAFASRWLGITHFGEFVYVRSVVASLLPFGGGGGNHAILRFGAITKHEAEKQGYFYSSLFYGTVFSLIIIGVLLVSDALFTITKSVVSSQMITLYSFFILCFSLYDLIRNYYRIRNDNKSFAYISMTQSLLSISLGVIGLLFFGYLGFLFFLVISPLLVFVFWVRNSLKRFQLPEFDRRFWAYGLSVGVGAFINQFTMNADILLLGYYTIPSEQIAVYKTATIILYSLFFIPSAFMTRDFTTLAASAEDQSILLTYLKQYYKYALFLLAVFVPLYLLFSEEVIILIFGEQYAPPYQIQNIFLIAFVSSVLLRIPFGTLLNSSGKAGWNVVNAVVSLPIGVGLLHYLIQMDGIRGAAFAMSALFTFSGLLSMGLFFYYIFLYTRTAVDREDGRA